MSGLESLDILIGLVTVYLIFGIVCTAIFEAIASWGSFRSSNLEKALGELLSGDLKSNLPFKKAFYDHPLIQSLSKGKSGRPSYIPAEIVGKVIHSLLVDNDSAKQLTDVIPKLPGLGALSLGALSIKRDELEAILNELPLGDPTEKSKFLGAFYSQGDFATLSKDTAGKPSLIPAEAVGKVVYSLLDTLTDKGKALKEWLSTPKTEKPQETEQEKTQTSPQEAAQRKAETARLAEKEFVETFNSKVLPDNRIKSLLATLVLETKDDVEKFRKAVETQFDAAMDRASGWFKRRQQWVTLIISAFVVIACNVDTLAIAQSLSTNPEVRAKLVEIAKGELDKAEKEKVKAEEDSKKAKDVAGDAAKKAEKPGAKDADRKESSEAKNTAEKADDAAKKSEEKTKAANNSLEEAKTTLKAAGLPLGWPCMAWEKECKLVGLSEIAGLLVSILAISLGAPFWFDVLQRFMRIRGAGVSPAESKEKTKP